jgi:FixJ family two-component response regulator
MRDADDDQRPSDPVDSTRSRLETLTPRERHVASLVAQGVLNKQIAAQVGLSEIAVKIHRGRVMRKMGVRSLAGFLQQAVLLEIGFCER